MNHSNFEAREVDLQRSRVFGEIKKFNTACYLNQIEGEYILRTTGRYPKTINKLLIQRGEITLNSRRITDFKFNDGVLIWSGGSMECFSGRIQFISEPIAETIELFGESRSQDNEQYCVCYGALMANNRPIQYKGPEIPDWARVFLVDIVKENTKIGGVMLWWKWEKQNFLTRFANKMILNFN